MHALLLALPLTLSLSKGAVPLLQTVEEASNGTRTGRYEEVQRLCETYPKAFSGKVRCEKFGMTPEGRPMLALIAGEGPGALDAKKAKASKRPVVLLQGGIHAGEIDGKDAGFRLLKALLSGKEDKALLKAVTLIFIPVFNVDGHERFGPNHRPNQRGPEEMGWRTTAQNLNLNRDAAKADAPETQALLQLLNAWDPILLADLHVTDGAKFQHDVAVLVQPVQVGKQPLLGLAEAAQKTVFAELKAKGHQPLDFYPAFNDDEKPESGFAYGIAPPRYQTSYWATRNRIGVLVEAHSWRPYAQRVQTTYDVGLALLRAAARDGVKWVDAAAKLDAENVSGTQQSLTWEAGKATRTIEFQGYRYTREDSQVSGQKWLRYDESKPEVWKVPLKYELLPTLQVTAPKGGYVVAVQHAAWVAQKLSLHGVAYEVLKAPKPAAPVESFRASAVKFRGAPYEGRLMVEVKGAWAKDQRELPAGSLFVPIAQPRAVLAMHLLEPAAPDSFVSWGFFNAHFERKEYMEDYVAEEVARAMLADAGVKAEFDALLKADAGFAKSPAARLEFFYAKHPSYDERFNLVPVYRVDFRSH
jgi:Zinc carboxypeptidase